jgi:predicted ribosome quality control (RQC) complex YloA/Tae2 family protein
MKTEVIYFQNLDQEITFYIGKNKHENFNVIDKGNPEDFWFHAKDESSCHVVAIIPEDEDFTAKELQSIIKRGAMLCKENTLKISSLSNVEFIYTKVKNVIKTNIPGCVTTSNTKKIIV